MAKKYKTIKQLKREGKSESYCIGYLKASGIDPKDAVLTVRKEHGGKKSDEPRIARGNRIRKSRT